MKARIRRAVLWLRGHLSDSARENLYLISGVLVSSVAALGHLSNDTSVAISAVVASSLTLILASINADRFAWASVYLVVGAAGGALQVLATSHETAAWSGFVGIAATGLAQIAAALRTPTTSDSAYVPRHSLPQS